MKAAVGRIRPDAVINELTSLPRHYTPAEMKAAAALWLGKVVTEVSPASGFWEAEPEHQDYLERIPHGYTCHFIRPDWKLPSRKEAGQSGTRAAE